MPPEKSASTSEDSTVIDRRYNKSENILGQFASVEGKPDRCADYVLANPPFDDSDWFRKDDEVRWEYGVPSRGSAKGPFDLCILR